MLGKQTLGNQTDYSLYSGKLARPILDVTECAILRTDGLDFLSWHQLKLLILQQYPLILRFGILSKSGQDAKKMFTDKVVPISVNYPFFFKPIQDGMDRPKTELAYRVPASKFTRRRLDSKDRSKQEALDQAGLGHDHRLEEHG